MAIQIAVGARVFVCDNMSFRGELIAIRKHTSKLDLGEEMDRAMYRYMQGFRRLRMIFRFRKTRTWKTGKPKRLSTTSSGRRSFRYDSFLLTRRKVRTQRPESGVDMHNCCTSHLKGFAPAPAFRATARIGKFFA